jgi:hypothetical protein
VPGPPPGPDRHYYRYGYRPYYRPYYYDRPYYYRPYPYYAPAPFRSASDWLRAVVVTADFKKRLTFRHGRTSFRPSTSLPTIRHFDLHGHMRGDIRSLCQWRARVRAAAFAEIASAHSWRVHVLIFKLVLIANERDDRRGRCVALALVIHSERFHT